MIRPSTEPAPSRRFGRLNFTALQFIFFAGAGLIGSAALLAAGFAFGLALAGAAVIAVLVLAILFLAGNMIGGPLPSRRHPPTP